MYYIKKNGEPVATTDPNEVTKENFLVEPGGENCVWVKLTKHEFDPKSGDKKMLVNQINAVNPGDFEFCARNWRQNDIEIEMLHDPRSVMKGAGVEDKLAKLKAGLGENQNGSKADALTEEDWMKTVEAKELAEKRAAEAEEKLRLLEEKEAERAKAEEEARLKAEAEAAANAEGEAKPQADAAEGESKTKGKTK